MELLTNLEKNLKDLSSTISDLQGKFMQSDLYKITNSALDFGLKAVLPDLIEDEIIDVKDTILESGLKEGVNQAVQNIKEFGKSVYGIITGNFENISQIQTAVKSGGILDTVSDFLDKAIDKACEKGLIDKSLKKTLKSGKNTILKNVDSDISESLDNQVKYLEKINEYNDKWYKNFENKDFNEMEKSYKNLKKYLDKTIPFEKTFEKARKIENLHTLIKNNGGEFNLSEEAIELASSL